MAKVLRCSDVGFECDGVIRAETEEEVVQKVRGAIRDEQSLWRLTGQEMMQGMHDGGMGMMYGHTMMKKQIDLKASLAKKKIDLNASIDKEASASDIRSAMKEMADITN